MSISHRLDSRSRSTEEVWDMSKRLIVSLVVVVAAVMFSSLLRAQDAKWNNIPPGRPAYNGKKPSGVPPKRDLTGIWDSGVMIQGSGSAEHPSSFPPGTPGGNGTEGGHKDEAGAQNPVPYTQAGYDALMKNLPSGPGLRQVDSV